MNKPAKERISKMDWKNLIVTDSDGCEYGPLGEMLNIAPANLDTATIEDGAISAWSGFFLSAPDEDPDYDTPRCEVDWSGFQEAFYSLR
jgi:hypothetical protein